MINWSEIITSSALSQDEHDNLKQWMVNCHKDKLQVNPGQRMETKRKGRKTEKDKRTCMKIKAITSFSVQKKERDKIM